MASLWLRLAFYLGAGDEAWVPAVLSVVAPVGLSPIRTFAGIPPDIFAERGKAAAEGACTGARANRLALCNASLR